MKRDVITVVNWNTEWRPSRSRAASVLRQRILDQEPDIVCLTEAYEDFLEGFGYRIQAEADYGYPLVPGRRKVLLWSKTPWRKVDCIGHVDMPSGRFISARTQTQIGDVDVIGICVPWSGAHVSSGRRDRQRWQDHIAYTKVLARLLPEGPRRTIVVGDYNQRIPRTTAPVAAFDALHSSVLDRFELATGGQIQPIGIQLIDHLAHSSDLSLVEVVALSNETPDGVRISDHVGVCVRLAREPL